MIENIKDVMDIITSISIVAGTVIQFLQYTKKLSAPK